MHGFDFLSNAPTNFIFEKNSNKTNLGGVFTLIYLIIVILITIAYMYDYSANSKYTVLYRSENIFKYDIESKIARDHDEVLNPKITFNFSPGASYIVPSHFVILAEDPNNENGKILHMGENFTVNLYDIMLHFYYICKGVDENDTCI